MCPLDYVSLTIQDIGVADTDWPAQHSLHIFFFFRKLVIKNIKI